jgi:hypothetical protein
MGHNRPLSKHQWVPFRRDKLSQILFQRPSQFYLERQITPVKHELFFYDNTTKNPHKFTHFLEQRYTFLNKMTKFAHKFE